MAHISRLGTCAAFLNLHIWVIVQIVVFANYGNVREGVACLRYHSCSRSAIARTHNYLDWRGLDY